MAVREHDFPLRERIRLVLKRLSAKRDPLADFHLNFTRLVNRLDEKIGAMIDARR